MVRTRVRAYMGNNIQVIADALSAAVVLALSCFGRSLSPSTQDNQDEEQTSRSDASARPPGQLQCPSCPVSSNSTSQPRFVYHFMPIKGINLLFTRYHICITYKAHRKQSEINALHSLNN